MSEPIKWTELTPEQRDKLVAEQVMGWKETECNGVWYAYQGYGPRGSDPGWYDRCSDCKATARWGEPAKHAQEPIPPYSTSMDAAWLVVEKMIARMGYADISFVWNGPLFKPEHHYLTAEGYPLGTTCWYVIVQVAGLREFICAKTPQDAICLAALKACGVLIEE